jgi:tRNA-dihydrouridine synthase B
MWHLPSGNRIMSEMFDPDSLLGSRALLLAPMEDVSDLPFRVIRRRLGADVVFTEFVSSEALIREKSQDKIVLAEEERPVGIQIFGGSAQAMADAAKIATDAGADLVDINFGCPVRKIVCKDAGAAALKDFDLMAQITRAVVNATHLPVTAKTRLGWSRDDIRIEEAARLLEDCGIRALTVHARTRKDGYKGEANWSYFPRIKAAVKIPVIGNGDINSPERARRAFDESGVDAIMIGRGAISDPWIFRRIKHYLETGGVMPECSLPERVELLLENLRMAIEYKGNERRATLEMRNIYSGYLRGHRGVAKVRTDLMQMETYAEVERRLRTFVETAAAETVETR